MAITYCIVCNVTGEKYYGSTNKTLEQRLSKHKIKSNRCCSRHIILRGDYDSYILGEYETIEEAEMKEDWYIDNKECINERRVRVTYEERKELKKEYYINNCEKFKEKEKIYRENNREKIKKYYEKNREKINEKKRERVICEICGKEYSRDSLTKHKRLLHFNTILADKDID